MKDTIFGFEPFFLDWFLLGPFLEYIPNDVRRSVGFHRIAVTVRIGHLITGVDQSRPII